MTMTQTLDQHAADVLHAHTRLSYCPPSADIADGAWCIDDTTLYIGEQYGEYELYSHVPKADDDDSDGGSYNTEILETFADVSDVITYLEQNRPLQVTDNWTLYFYQLAARDYTYHIDDDVNDCLRGHNRTQHDIDVMNTMHERFNADKFSNAKAWDSFGSRPCADCDALTFVDRRVCSDCGQ